jgi:hypothetical protein
MLAAIIPVAIVLIGAGGYVKTRKSRGEMTPERLKIFNAAISGALKDPASLDKLASAFSGEGLHEQAKLLRQRAALKRLPLAVKQARAEVWRRAIASKNKAGILQVAAAYDREGCTSAALRLREIASGLPEKIPEPEEPIINTEPTVTDQTPPEDAESVAVTEESGEAVS